MDFIAQYNQWIFWFDHILFFLVALPVAYILIFALASLHKRQAKFLPARKEYRYVFLIPGFEIDDRIYETIYSLHSQDFPDVNYDIVVIPQKIDNENLKKLVAMQVTVLSCPKQAYSRRTALQHAVEQLNPDQYDVAVILKPTNTLEPDFLKKINQAYHSGGTAIQTHRISKRVKGSMGTLSALSEEINNSIFRRGHVNLGLSSSLIGSGMAFKYTWFRENILKMQGYGITKDLEARLLRQGIYIEYLENVPTYEDKTNSFSAINRQRKDWYNANKFSMRDAMRFFPRAFFAGNIDYCDKIFQWRMPSRFLLILYIIAFAVALSFVEFALSLKWIALLIALLFAFLLAIPERFINIRTFFAFLSLPFLIFAVIFDKMSARFSKTEPAEPME